MAFQRSHESQLVADGLFRQGGWFHVLPKTGIRPLEEIFRARTIAFLVNFAPIA